MKSPETAIGALVPGAGVFAYSGHCAALSDALRVCEDTLRRNGRVPSPQVVSYRELYEKAAADYQRITSDGTSVLAKSTSALPISDWVSVRHAAKALRVSERWICYLIDNGTLRAEKDARHQWRIDPQTIENERARRTHEQGDHQGTDSG